MAKIILMDWQRGKIPYFVPPFEQEKQEVVENESDNNQKVKNLSHIIAWYRTKHI